MLRYAPPIYTVIRIGIIFVIFIIFISVFILFFYSLLPLSVGLVGRSLRSLSKH
jgi:hypothetical protein